MESTYDVIIVGGGIVGLATGYQLLQNHPGKRLLIIEKESTVAAHQTGHNSGVLHSGIYYRPGTLRALNCRTGKQAMERFCAEHGITYEICGKVIVAVDESELPALERIYDPCSVATRSPLNIVDMGLVREVEVDEAGVFQVQHRRGPPVGDRVDHVAVRLRQPCAERRPHLVTVLEMISRQRYQIAKGDDVVFVPHPAAVRKPA